MLKMFRRIKRLRWWNDAGKNKKQKTKNRLPWSNWKCKLTITMLNIVDLQARTIICI